VGTDREANGSSTQSGDGTAMIRVDKVVKTHRVGATKVHALAGVSLDIPAGTFVSIMGPSGSGKSTLLYLMGGVDLPDSGDIRIGDRSLIGLSEDERSVFRRQNIGFVFQFFNLLPTLSAEENVALPLLLDGKRMRDVRPRVEQLLRAVNLWDRREHLPEALSGGEMQRIAIARALVIEPAVLLADEPTGNLDSKTGKEILGLIRGMARRLKQTVVMVTHDPNAAAFGNRTITLRDGTIESDADSGEIPAGDADWGPVGDRVEPKNGTPKELPH
jgi:putative ABC transport system ATP-binding protein